MTLADTERRAGENYLRPVVLIQSEPRRKNIETLDVEGHQGHMKFWVRNLVRREGCSFFLQKADGRFYPDFLCQLADGVVLVVEYPGANLWPGAEDDRLIGGLWAELSKGACRFVMVKNREWHQIDNAI